MDDHAPVPAALPELWQNQLEGIDAVLAAESEGVRTILLTSPCGGGKARMLAELAKVASARRQPSVLFTNRRVLTSQLSDTYERSGLPHGVLAAGYEQDRDQLAQIAGLQTIHARCLETDRWELPPAGMVLIDEAHLVKEAVAQHLIKHYLARGATVIGTTATPVNLGHIYARLVVAGTNSELRRRGMLVPIYCFAPDEPDMKGVTRTQVGEYTHKGMVKRVMQTTVFGDVFEHWRRINPRGWPTVVFAPSVEDSAWFALQWNQRGVRAEHIDGTTNDQKRAEIFAGSRDGSIPVVTSCDVLREGVDCLDMQTEVLTCSGWKGFGNIGEEELIYTLNRETNFVEVEPVQRLVDRPTRAGEMMVKFTSQHQDIRVTDGHELHFRGVNQSLPENLSENWFTWTAAEMLNRRPQYNLPVSGMPHPMLYWQGVPLSDDEIRFVAWFMTDGYRGTKGNGSTIEIGQSEEFHHDVRALLKRLGYTFEERLKPCKSGYKTGKSYYYVFNVPRGVRQGSVGWNRLETYLDKSGSPLLRGMTRAQFKVFWEELLKGDLTHPKGKRGHKNGCLICTPGQADLYSELAVTRGFACNVLSFKTAKGKPMAYVRIRDRRYLGSAPRDPRSGSITAEQPAEGERVWCVTTRNGTIFTRRNGKIAILGNCPWLRVGILIRACAAVSTFIQITGRLARSYPGKDHAILIDHSGSVNRLGSPNADRDWCLKDTDRSIAVARKAGLERGEIREPITCPECGAVRKAGPECWACGHRHKLGVRMVRMLDGTLVRKVGQTVKRKPPPGQPQQIWIQCLIRSARGVRPQTVGQAAALYKRTTGHELPDGIPHVPPRGSPDWSRHVGQVFPWAARRKGAAT